MKFSAMAILVAMLCACGAFPQPQSGKQILSKTAAKWVGRTVDELIVENGEPTNVDALDAGVRVFEYGKIETGQAKTRKRTKRHTYGGREIVISGSGQLQLGTDSLPPSDINRTFKAKSSGQPCRILFTISASDIVEKWSIEGGDTCTTDLAR